MSGFAGWFGPVLVLLAVGAAVGFGWWQRKQRQVEQWTRVVESHTYGYSHFLTAAHSLIHVLRVPIARLNLDPATRGTEILEFISDVHDPNLMHRYATALRSANVAEMQSDECLKLAVEIKLQLDLCVRFVDIACLSLPHDPEAFARHAKSTRIAHRVARRAFVKLQRELLRDSRRRGDAIDDAEEVTVTDGAPLSTTSDPAPDSQ